MGHLKNAVPFRSLGEGWKLEPILASEMFKRDWSLNVTSIIFLPDHVKIIIMSEKKDQAVKNGEFVQKHAKRGRIYIMGLLGEVRGGATLQEVHQRAINEPDNEEHVPAWNRAKDFLEKHAEELGIEAD